MKKTKKGFTLVELLVVIAILAVLTTVTIIGYVSFVNKADQSATQSEAHQIDTLIEASLTTADALKIKNGLWITKTENGYVAITTEPSDAIDISTDLSDFASNLTNSNGALIYTSRGYVVNVDTGETNKQ